MSDINQDGPDESASGSGGTGRGPRAGLSSYCQDGESGFISQDWFDSYDLCGRRDVKSQNVVSLA